MSKRRIVRLLCVLFFSCSFRILSVAACSPREAPESSPDGDRAGAAPRWTDAHAGTTALLAQIARAEDLRRIRDLPPEAATSRDVTVRRATARALARILDRDDAALLRALEDEDDEVIAWASYGLGESCKGNEDSHVRAIAARLASTAPSASAPPPPPPPPPLRPPSIRQGPALLRAIGRCGGDIAEAVLIPFLRDRGDMAEAAAFALGECAAKRGVVSPAVATALIDAALAPGSLDAALYAFGRAEPPVSQELSTRLASAAKAALGRPGPLRFLAIRALGHVPDVPPAVQLETTVLSSDATPTERVEAVLALARLGKSGKTVAADALSRLVAARPDPLALRSPAVILALIGALPTELPAKTESALWALARIDTPAAASAPVERRASALRCAAAARLAHAAWDSDGLQNCDRGDGQIAERARLDILNRRPFGKAASAAWLELTRSKHPRVREAALDLISGHPELGDVARVALARALASPDPGLVAVAAQVVHAHPARAFVTAAGGPPALSPAAGDIDPGVARALQVALARPFAADAFGARVAVLDAALAVGLAEGRTSAIAACKDPNITVRTRAARALASIGERTPDCAPDEAHGDAAIEAEHPEAGAVTITLDTDSGLLTLRLDPTLAPVAVTRLASLARAGFFAATTFHRVVPGFVVQFGDPGGDGYGGSGNSLRCETSPVPFAPFDVGVALSGRDTGSSQMFVTLARAPHLDGEYAWIGRAEGDWNGVVEDDVIRAVRVSP